MKRYWEIIADKLSKAGWTWGCVATVDAHGRTIFVADAHRDDGKRFVVHADDKLTAFLNLKGSRTPRVFSLLHDPQGAVRPVGAHVPGVGHVEGRRVLEGYRLAGRVDCDRPRRDVALEHELEPREQLRQCLNAVAMLRVEERRAVLQLDHYGERVAVNRRVLRGGWRLHSLNIYNYSCHFRDSSSVAVLRAAQFALALRFSASQRSTGWPLLCFTIRTCVATPQA